MLILATPTYAATNLCSCVSYVHSLVPEAPLVNADQYKPNISAHVGAIAIFHYGPSAHYPHGTGHVALVTAIRSGAIAINESNYHSCAISDRWVSLKDPTLIGFWYATP